MSNHLQLEVLPRDSSLLVNLSWSQSTPSNVIEYVIFYRKVGSKRVKSLSTTSLSITISNLINGEKYNVQALAFNGSYASGERLSDGDTEVVQCIPGTVPGAPVDLTATVSTSENIMAGQIGLEWTAPATDSNYPILNYKLYISTDNIAFTSSLLDASDVSHLIENLQNGTLYYIKLSAINLVGESLKSLVQATPLDLASVPRDLAINIDHEASDALADGYQKVEVTWLAPTDTGGSAITGYAVDYSLLSDFSDNVFTYLTNSSSTSATITNAGLIIPVPDKNTTTGWYFFRVRPITALGDGANSSIATIRASILPHAVENLAGSNVNADGDNASGTVTLTWSYTIDDTCPLLGYIVAYLDDNDELQSRFVHDVTVSPKYTIDGLTNGTSYEFAVSAINMLGASAEMTTDVIPSTVASAPTNVSLLSGDQQLTIQFSAPDDDAGSAILQYRIYKSTDGGSSYSVLITQDVDDYVLNNGVYSYVDTVVSNGTSYFYRVSAINANGEGALSDADSDYPSTVPDAPTLLSVDDINSSSTGKRLRVTWSAPANDGGSSITNYELYRDDILINSINALSFVDNDIAENGVSYEYKVIAINRDGASDYSNAISNMATGKPDAPTITSVVASDGRLTVHFTAGNNEGKPIIRFNKYVSSDDSNYYGPYNINLNTSFDDLVDNGELTYYKVSAVNANGEGDLSSAMSGIACRVPDAPTGLSAVHGNQQVTLSFDLLAVAPSESPSDEGRAISQYKIYQSTDNVTYTNVDTILGALTNSKTISNLTNGQLYYYKIAGVNSVGEGDMTSAVSARPSTSPSTVRSVLINSVNENELDISWQAPLTQGGLAYHYVMYLYKQSNFSLVYSNTNISTTSVAITELEADTMYIMHLYASNGVDTNYNEYISNAFVVGVPARPSGLSYDGTMLHFSYNTEQYQIIDFTIVVYDGNADQYYSEVISSHLGLGADPHMYLVDIKNDMGLPTGHLCKVSVIARNQYANSPISNNLTVTL